MTRSHRVRCVGLAGGLVLMSLLSPVLEEPLVDPEPSVERFEEQLKRFKPTKPVSERLAALRWLDLHTKAINAPLAIPALEERIRKDREAKVRLAALDCLGSIVLHQHGPCPLALVEALLDKDENVMWAASGWLGLFRIFAPGSVEIFLRCVGSENASLRANVLVSLAQAGGDDPMVLAALGHAQHDQCFRVRHNAHVAVFRATDNLEEFLTYLVRLQEDPDGVVGPVDANTKEGKEDLETKNLVQGGSTQLFVRWSENRPNDLAPALLKLLSAPSAAMRRGAARLIGVSAQKVAFAENGLPKDWKNPKPLDPPQPSQVVSRFELLKAVDRLRELSENDPDATVRAAATVALDRLASVREPRPTAT